MILPILFRQKIANTIKPIFYLKISNYITNYSPKCMNFVLNYDFRESFIIFLRQMLNDRFLSNHIMPMPNMPG